MAKTIIFTLCAALLLPVAGCKKQTGSAAPGNEATATSAIKVISATSFTYYAYGKTITEDDFLRNYKDAADEKFNYVNHAMTLGLLDIYQNNPVLMAALVSEINNSKNKELNLYKVADAHPAIDGIMDNIFAERFSDFNNGDWRSYVAAHYVYDTAYVPFVGFMNIGKVDGSMPAYVSEPLELNEEKFTQFDDDYPMWVMDTREGSLKFTSVNEEMGYYLTNPIVRIANGFEGDDVEDYLTVPSQFDENGKSRSKPPPGDWPINPGTNVPHNNDPNLPVINEWITHVKFQINERYENWGKSDYKFGWIAVSGYKNSNNAWLLYPNTSESETKKVKKEEIGTMINFYFDVFSKGYYPSSTGLSFSVQGMPISNYCKFAVGAYEYDWGNKPKHIYTVCAENGDIYGRRKYQHEWYFIDEAMNHGYPFNIRNPNRHTSFISTNKGYIQLHRWDLE